MQKRWDQLDKMWSPIFFFFFINRRLEEGQSDVERLVLFDLGSNTHTHTHITVLSTWI